MRIKNWSEFQHYKDRDPKWIKLYRYLLDDIEWHLLDPKCAKVLVMLWLIAAEKNGFLPDSKTLAFRLRLSVQETETICSKLHHWLEQDASNPLADVEQDASLEKIREDKKREEQKQDGFALPSWVPSAEWSAFLEQRKAVGAKNTDRSLVLLVGKLDEYRNAGLDIAELLATATINSWKSIYPPKGYKPPAKETSDWWTAAGFANQWEAANAQCFEHNAKLFRDGKKQEAA
jgi:hypothetical protein